MPAKLIEFGPDQAEALEKYSRRFGQSQSQIIRDSFRLFRTIVREAERGNQVGIVNGERVVSQITGPWSDAEPA